MAAKKKAGSKAGMRCVTFTKTARKGGEKYSAAEQKKHSYCFKKKGTKDTATTYKHEPKTKHPGNMTGLQKACQSPKLKPNTKAGKMLAPACFAIGYAIGG